MSKANDRIQKSKDLPVQLKHFIYITILLAEIFKSIIVSHLGQCLEKWNTGCVHWHNYAGVQFGSNYIHQDLAAEMLVGEQCLLGGGQKVLRRPALLGGCYPTKGFPQCTCGEEFLCWPAEEPLRLPQDGAGCPVLDSAPPLWGPLEQLLSYLIPKLKKVFKPF